MISEATEDNLGMTHSVTENENRLGQRAEPEVSTVQ